MTILRDCYEGLVSEWPPTGAANPGRGGNLVAVPGRHRLYISGARGRALVERRSSCRRRGLRGRVPPAHGTGDRIPVRIDAGTGTGTRPTSSPAGSRPRRSVSWRRMPARSSSRLARPRPYFLAMLSHPSTFPAHRPTLGAKREVRRRHARYRGHERRLRAGGLGDRLAHHERCATRTTGTMPRTTLDAVRYVHVADPVTELTRFRAGDLDVTYTVPPGEVARLEQELPRPASHRAACRRVLLRLRARPAALQGRAEAAAGARDGDRPRACSRGRCSATASGRPMAGCRRASPATTPQRFDWARLDAAARIAEAKRLYAEAGYSRGEAAAGRAAHQQEPAARSHRARRDGDVEGASRRRGEPALRGLPRAESRDRRARGAALPRELDRRLQRRLLLPADAERRELGINLPRYASDTYDVALAMAAVSRTAKNAGPISQWPSANCSPTFR